MIDMKQLDVKTAFDERSIEWLELDDSDLAERAMARAHGLYRDRDSWLPKYSRIEILGRAARLLAERAEPLARTVALEGGKPLSDARVEVARAVEGLELAASELSRLSGREVPMDVTRASAGHSAYTYFEPSGVVLAISAFNHPLNLVVHQVAPAVAGGCPVLVKPSLLTPLSCRALVDVLQEAGLPPGFCRMLLVEDAVAERLVRDPRTAFLSFIGSARVGWKLRSLLSPGARAALEHGGLAPMIVCESANLDDALPLIVKGSYYHAGQVCVSGQRLYAHRRIHERLLAGLVARVRELRVGDPLDPATEVGPLIARREVERVDAWVKEAVDAGARLHVGGERLGDTLYAPTLLEDVPPGCQLARGEVFGPVLCLEAYDDERAVVERANDVDAYFQASVFTRDLEQARDLSRRLHGMAVMLNEHSAFRVDWMPFGGHRSSGLGVGGIGHGLREMSIERMVVTRTGQTADNDLAS